MRRYRDPALLVFLVALLGSLAVHLPVYEGLGQLAKYLREKAALASSQPITVDFTVGEGEPVPEPEPEAPHPDRDVDVDVVDGEPDPTAIAREAPARPPPPRPRAVRERERERELEAVPEPEPTPETEQEPVQEQPQPLQLHAVEQHAHTEEAPDEARYIAEQANRVDEETVARLTNMVRNDEEQAAGEMHASEEEELGDSEEQEVLDLREMEGSDQRAVTPEEAEEPRPREASTEDPPNVTAAGDGRTAGQDSELEEGSPSPGVQEQRAEQATAARAGGGEPLIERLEIHDGIGTFYVERQVSPEGVGAGSDGGRGAAARSATAGQSARPRTGRRGAGAGRGAEGPDLRVAWSQFEDIMDPAQLEREREARLEERRSSQRGSNHQRRWREFRAAIENYTSQVRPGNQTSLNAAASPFATYISRVHQRIHRQFAQGYLPQLPTYSSSPLADTTLRTKLEIILNRDGTVHRIGVVRSSGLLVYDFGAYNSVMRAQPFPEAPPAILSGDGRVYLHWAFYRNERQCGPFNAEPYILPHPPGSPERRGGPAQDGPEWGGVVPRDANPSWGTDRERRPGRGGPGGDGEGDAPEREPGAPPREEEGPPPSDPPSGGGGGDAPGGPSMGGALG